VIKTGDYVMGEGLQTLKGIISYSKLFSSETKTNTIFFSSVA